MRKLSALVGIAVAAVSMAARAGDGAALFMQNCLMCHQSGAVGLTGQFPRLAGRVGIISSKPAGRAYLIDVVTNGLAGNIVVDGQPITGLMPSFAQLPDDVVASILSYVQTLGDAPAPVPAAFTPDEVKIGRALKSAAEVQEERQVLQRAKAID